MNPMRAAVIILFCVFLGCANVYSQNKSILQLADEYSLALAKYETQIPRRSAESVLRKGKAVSGQIDEIEALSETDYALLEKKMRGFTVNRDEILFIEPDLKFFHALAQKRGTKADLAFFSLMRELKPDNVWAAYYEPQTDVSACTLYGGGLLTRFYGRALQFKNDYPKAYVEDIDKEISDILEQFSDHLCACGDRASVVKEFRSFIKTFPKDKKTPEIKRLLKNINKNKDFRFNCQSG